MFGLEKYNYTSDKTFKVYSFMSNGPNVGSIIYDFTNIFMDALIFIQGTTAARTRLYQININKHWERIDPIFEVFGLKNERWEHFKKRVNYDAFLGRRKGALGHSGF